MVKREDEKRGEGDAPVLAANAVMTADIFPSERSVTLKASAVSAATRASNRRHRAGQRMQRLVESGEGLGAGSTLDGSLATLLKGRRGDGEGEVRGGVKRKACRN
jgi:hypothetical protein